MWDFAGKVVLLMAGLIGAGLVVGAIGAALEWFFTYLFWPLVVLGGIGTAGYYQYKKHQAYKAYEPHLPTTVDTPVTETRLSYLKKKEARGELTREERNELYERQNTL